MVFLSFKIRHKKEQNLKHFHRHQQMSYVSSIKRSSVDTVTSKSGSPHASKYLAYNANSVSELVTVGQALKNAQKSQNCINHQKEKAK